MLGLEWLLAGIGVFILISYGFHLLLENCEDNKACMYILRVLIFTVLVIAPIVGMVVLR